LGTPGLFDADEPAYAQAAREMLETGDWITPHFNGQPRFDKPILFYWLITLSYSAFGITEFAVRFWSALAAVALVLVVAWGGRRWFGPPADLWAGLAFTTNLLAALLARAAVTDMLLTLFVTLAILGGLRALEAPAGSRAWAGFCWAAMGLAVLVKGPVGILIPAMALGGTVLAFREWHGGIARLFPWEGPVLFAAIVFPWYGLVLAANGWAFVEGFLIKHHLTRYTGVVSAHPGPIWYYLPVILVGFFPWSGFLPRILWEAGVVAGRRTVESPADRLLVACACWLGGVFLFFSLAGTKLPSYLFPAFPAMALLVGAAISSEKRTTQNRPTRNIVDRSSVVGRRFSIERGRVERWLVKATPWLVGLMGGILAVGFGLVPWLLDWLRPVARGALDGVAPPTGVAWWLAFVLILGTGGSLVATGPRRPAVLSAMMACVILTAETVIAPHVYTILQGPLREFTEDARKFVAPGIPVVAYGLNAPSIVFYADRRVASLAASGPNGPDRLRQLVEAGGPVVVITRSAHVSRLDGVPGLFRLKARGGYALYSSVRPAEGNPN
jgi:4-amino-4-deoxy-L-arabinose transferase-like glycosyltransferase